MKPLKIIAGLSMIALFSACESDSLDLTESKNQELFNKKESLKTETSDVNGCETAFAKFIDICEFDGYVFASNSNSNPEGYPTLDLSPGRWGWAANIAPGWWQEKFELWAGAGKNDTSKGVHVGNVIVRSVSATGLLRVTYKIFPDYTMSELHIYANDLKPTTIAPGQFGFTKEFSPGTDSFTYDFNVKDTDGDGVWVIAHAVICSN